MQNNKTHLRAFCWSIMYDYITMDGKKFPRYRPGVAQRVGRGIALLFHDRGTGSGWVVSSTFRPHFTPGKGPVPIVQEAGWAPGPVWTGGKSRPHRDSIPDRPARIQSVYRLSYPAHTMDGTKDKKGIFTFYCAGYMITLKTQNFLNGQMKQSDTTAGLQFAHT